MKTLLLATPTVTFATLETFICPANTFGVVIAFETNTFPWTAKVVPPVAVPIPTFEPATSVNAFTSPVPINPVEVRTGVTIAFDAPRIPWTHAVVPDAKLVPIPKKLVALTSDPAFSVVTFADIVANKFVVEIEF